MEGLIELQGRTGGLISRTVINLRKKGEASFTPGIVEARIGRLKELMVEFRERHEIICKSCKKTEGVDYFDNDYYDEIEEVYRDELGALLDIKSTLEPSNRVVASIGGQAHPTQGHQSQPPRLNLPRFSGTVAEWRNFRDLFKSMIIDRPDIPEIQKLQHLKTCLSGEPAQLLFNLPVTEDNLERAWKILDGRYDNKRVLVDSYVRLLFQISPAQSETPGDLRRIYNSTREALGALESLDCPVDKWDILLVYMTVQRLDPKTRRDWETSRGSQRKPATFAELSEFIESRVHALEALGSDSKSHSVAPASKTGLATTSGKLPSTSSNAKRSFPSRKVYHAATGVSAQSSTPVRRCSFCRGPHYILGCPQFRSKTQPERRSEVTRLGLCYNCLGNHPVKDCKSSGRCSTCNGRHNSILHPETVSSGQSSSSGDTSGARSSDAQDSTTANASVEQIHSHHAASANSLRSVLLATARIRVSELSGNSATLRVLFDQGSEVSFLTEASAQLLQLERVKTQMPLVGLGAKSSGVVKTKSIVYLSSDSMSEDPLKVEVYILPKLTAEIPTQTIVDLPLFEVQELQLADPHFHRPGRIDMILGADVYSRVLCEGLKPIAGTGIVAQNTLFGWIVSGQTSTGSPWRAVQRPKAVLHCTIDYNLDQALRQFWEVDEISSQDSCSTPEDDWCEQHFRDTHSRTSSGRYIVRLPFKSSRPVECHEMRGIAISSLKWNERKFRLNSRLSKQYSDFIEEYENLGHMTRLPSGCDIPTIGWYLPHHGVIQDAGLTDKKIRVVFDASRKSSSGRSLNDFLHTGPALQNDLTSVLTRWRCHRFVFTADMVKMYRQILVHPDDRCFQRVVWKEPGSNVIQDFELDTVTYGMNCAPFQALRTVRQMALDEGSTLPFGAQCLLKDTFVDDVFAGANNLSTALQVQSQVIELLSKGGFPLDKWAANHPDLLGGIPAYSRTSNEPLSFDSQGLVKTLGIVWDPSSDAFSFRVANAHFPTDNITKRQILSCVAKMYDPLGWIAPVIVEAKILIQDIWILGVDWDSTLSDSINLRWVKYCESIRTLLDIRIERWIGYCGTDSRCEIHGFADASSRAYAAVVYLKVVTDTNEVYVSLLMAKTKVSPVKTVTIPRLELCGAALLTRLVIHVRKFPGFESLPVTAWSDSQVTLSWLRKHPSNWKTFVANRVSFIQTSLPSTVWNYVPTADNPADLASRGATSESLNSSVLWWHGPQWLRQESDGWPHQAWCSHTSTVEPQIVALSVQELYKGEEIITRFSSLITLFRVIAYCLRFIHRLRNPREERVPQPLTANHLADSKRAIIRMVQHKGFAAEILALNSNQALSKRSSILKLDPFLDEHGIIRVGGRLRHSFLPYQERHPIILPSNSHLSYLYVDHIHKSSLHGGISLTLNLLQRQVWIVSARRVAKSYIRKCVRCHRAKPQLGTQLMGDLPSARTHPGRAFSRSGLDYAGPFQIRTSKGRGNKSTKGYVALFICFATRAIHLEAVSDCTTQSFLAAYRRFTGRRGICTELYSDNSTTFRGADSELRTLFKQSSEMFQEASQLMANDGTTWKFIPPGSPHFGGLWEAGVKSVKYHLVRVAGEATPTFEEFSTLLVQVEACLNSRPLCPLSSDPDDLGALTPSHFLIGTATAMIPEPDVSREPESHLSRWQYVQRMVQHFWQRWSREYLHHLQERSKWRTTKQNFSVGQLVLVKDDRYPPSKWALGRIIAAHPGADGHVRVVDVRTLSSTLRRAIHKLSPLPIDGQSQANGV